MGPEPSFEDLQRAVQEGAEALGHLDRLRRAVEIAGRLSEMSDLLVDSFVQTAREAGHTWAEIGGVLGVTKQAAQQRFISGSAEERRKVAAVAALKGDLEGLQRALGLPGLDRFSEDARRAVASAREQAKKLGHSLVGSQHLLLGVMDRPHWVSAVAMAGMGFSREAIRRKVKRASTTSERTAGAAGEIRFSSRAKTALALAMREALRMGENRIGPEHMLVALLRDVEGSAATILDHLGVDPAELRRAVRKEAARRHEGDGPSATEAPSAADAGDEPR